MGNLSYVNDDPDSPISESSIKRREVIENAGDS